MTMDVDVTISVTEERVRPLVAALLRAGFASRTDDLEAFFARSRVIPLLHRRTKMPLDGHRAWETLGLPVTSPARGLREQEQSVRAAPRARS
ncbi:MAG: hypothetical protein L6Q84_05870 [Polyangiaceae bacterium]|nr:hypothetical protein [Polyangiaceae bacterium]